MKITPVLIACALLALHGPSIAKAQTKSSTPPPPPLAKTLKSEAKGRRAIPPPPPLSSIRSPRKKRSTVARSNPLHSPGTDPTGRMDLEGKNVAFYPIVKGDVVKPNMQQSALKKGTTRGSGGGVNPKPPVPEMPIK